MREMGDTIVQCAKLVEEAIPLLRSINAQAGRISEICERISHLEGRADELHDLGLKDLFRLHSMSNSTEFFIGHEIYDHLEKVVDRFDDVGNEIHGIVIEHV